MRESLFDKLGLIDPITYFGVIGGPVAVAEAVMGIKGADGVTNPRASGSPKEGEPSVRAPRAFGPFTRGRTAEYNDPGEESTMITRLLVVGAFGALGLSGCGSDESGPPAVANPASEFCVEQGGTVEIVEGAGGQQGICVLPDGTRIDEWEYFRQQGGTTTSG